MFSSFLVLVLLAGALARPDVSHLKEIQNKQIVSSYDAPVNSVNSQYVRTSHTFGRGQEVPSLTYLPPYLQRLGDGNQQVYYVSQSGGQQENGQGSGNQQQVYYVSQSGQQQIPITVTGGTSSSASQGNVQYVSQGQGQGNVHVSQGAHGGLNLVSQGSQSQSQGGSGHVLLNNEHLVKSQERVYFFSAPDDIIEHRSRLRINIVPTHTKNTNVIFVKAPSTGKIIPEVVVPSHQIIEDKTKVVVLVKENDHYVPLTVHTPPPVNRGKAEVVVVKYHDKNDAARVVAGGPAVGATLTSQDKSTFIHGNGGTIVSRFSSSDANANTASVNVKGVSKTASVDTTESVLAVVSESPKIQTYSSDSSENTSNLGGQGAVNDGDLKILTLQSDVGSVEGAKIDVNVAQNQEGVVKSNVETKYEFKSVNSDQSSNVNANQGSSDQTYQIKTVDISEKSPVYNLQDASSLFVSNADQQGIRFSGDNSGYSQGYTVKTSEINQNLQGGQYVDYGNLDNLKKLLGDGIEIVSVSKGTLQASGYGGNAQDTILRSLGVSSDLLKHGVSAVSERVNGADLGNSQGQQQFYYQTSGSTGGSDGTRQIQIGNDVADVISGSSLKE
ncbi:hypothetical protein RI129_009080 [Pyrocoelia pectoralis]|uniref:DUF243 domain-containing protein n=1 Tax=Pyrocoelia pectoralis TaxID=417401 RepID=A0AAN7V9T1_9COLE